jgi:hypothetical protein
MEGTAPEQETSKMVRSRAGRSLRRVDRKKIDTPNPYPHIRSGSSIEAILLHFVLKHGFGGTIFIPPQDGYCL